RVDRRPKLLRPGAVENPQLVPEVLGTFAPLVEVRGRRIRQDRLQGPPPLAVAPRQSRSDQLPGVAVQLPLVDLAPTLLDRLARLGQSPVVFAVGGLALVALALEHPLPALG